MLCLFILAFVTGAWAATTTRGPTVVPTHHQKVTVGQDLTVALTLSFNAIDQDKNGQIDVGEFDKTFIDFDTDNDLKLTEQEYAAGSKTDPVLAKAVFKFLDGNNDGFIVIKDINRIFMLFDKNRNGVIDIREFLAEYTKLFAQILSALPAGYTFPQLQPTVPST